ncbi:MAG: hypothetical protein GY937_10460 [bacterium]|nr:hypothetical protein [bacterium]
MRRSLRALVLLLAVAAPAAGEAPAPQTREQALAQNVSKVRQVLEQEAVTEDQELRRRAGCWRSRETVEI